MLIHDVDQNSNEWIELRRGIPTGSMFSKLCTTKGDRSKSISDAINEKVANVIANETLETWQGNQWTERGHELEQDAADYYQFMNGDRKLKQVGFVTDDENTCGCSPDRLVNDDGLLEIKCPMPKTHVKYLLAKEIPSDYYLQVQGQLMITGREWCDFMSYHPLLPPLLIREYRNEDLIEKLKGHIEYFNKELERRVNAIKGC